MIVTFEDYTPLPRYDGLPWTHVKIEEAPESGGPWTLIDTINFADPDADPVHPKTRNFTTNEATLEDGWYRVTFLDQGNNAANPTPSVHRSQSEDYAPTVAQVARHLLSRTRDRWGNEAGTFTASTRPTDTQVLALIQDAITKVADEVGDEIPVELFDDAADVVAERVAMQIELDYYSDQVNTNRSPYSQLKDLYREDLGRLQKSVTEALASEGHIVDTGPSNMPSFSYPQPTSWLDRIM